MGQSLVENYVHLVFSTKHRENLILKPRDKDLFRYIAVVSKSLECPAVAVGGYLDHIHILCRLSTKLALMTYVQKVKANSSRWYKTLDSSLQHFYWQDGYAAFSVSKKEVPRVVHYIQNQENHHKSKGYKKEILAMLKEKGMDYNEQYLWD